MEMNQLNDPQVEEKEMDITKEAEEVVVPKKKITIWTPEWQSSHSNNVQKV